MFSKFGIREYHLAELESIFVLFLFIAFQDALEEVALLGRQRHGRHGAGTARRRGGGGGRAAVANREGAPSVCLSIYLARGEPQLGVAPTRAAAAAAAIAAAAPQLIGLAPPAPPAPLGRGARPPCAAA